MFTLIITIMMESITISQVTTFLVRKIIILMLTSIHTIETCNGPVGFYGLAMFGSGILEG